MTKHRHSSLPHLLAIACAVLGSGSVAAAEDSTAQARYQREMAVCDSGRSNQDLATCRIEARNALAAARQGGLNDAPGQYKDNAQQRCGALEGIELRACEARMRGEGSVEGSVAGGGLLRENVTVVPAQ